jgi:hypothetical protein
VKAAVLTGVIPVFLTEIVALAAKVTSVQPDTIWMPPPWFDWPACPTLPFTTIAIVAFPPNGTWYEMKYVPALRTVTELAFRVKAPPVVAAAVVVRGKSPPAAIVTVLLAL